MQCDTELSALPTAVMSSRESGPALPCEDSLRPTKFSNLPASCKQARRRSANAMKVALRRLLSQPPSY